MEYRFTIYSLIHLPALVMTLAAVPYAWGFRKAPGLLHLALLEVSAAIWIAAAGMEMAAATLPLKIFWSQVTYIGLMSAPVFLFLFASEYAQPRSHFGWKHIALLFVVPVLTWIIMLVDDLRPLIWPSISIDPNTNIGAYSHGPWFWVEVLFVYCLLVAAMLSLFTRLLRLSVYFRRQIPIFAIASALPIVSNILYVTGLNPIPSLDWTPLAFGFMSILLAWGVLQQKHFKMVPIAPERLSDYLAEGIIVLDSQDRIVELNVALQRLFDFSLKDVVGKLLAEVVGSSEEMRVLLASEGEQRVEVALEARGLLRVFEARLLPLSDWRGRATGRLLVLRDITADKLLAQGREDLIQGLQEALAHVKMLQGLLPICANCKRIRDDQGYWHSVESYISEHSDATFTHGLCPDCARELYPELFKDRDERVG